MTSTSQLEGWEITDYLGVVSTSIVAGTGLFTEFLAGWTDLFGGRSKAFKSQLETLHREAIAQLMARGNLVSADWLIGLHIDHDEISGKNMQMLMVSAHATAVRARRSRSGAASEEPTVSRVTGDEVQAFRHRLDLVKKAEPEPFVFTPEDWRYATEQRVAELIEPALREAARDYAGYWRRIKERGGPASRDETKELRAPIAGFLSSLPIESTSATVFQTIRANPRLGEVGCGLMADLALGDLTSSLCLLQDPDPALRHLGVQSLTAQQPSYVPGDLAVIDQVIQALRQPFSIRAGLKEGKTLLGGTKKLWTCICTKDQAAEIERCTECTRDRRGFRQTDLQPSEAIAQLEHLQESLTAAFSTAGP